ncbi:MAG TPA: PH domain-containing protein [Thermoanaerobaculia bacterium]|nr:PH domain-containing protein [Thermoanaerobaculia bacterium]
MKEALLAFLRVAERPDPPPGSEGTLSTFRASPRFLALSAIEWGLKQAGALFGIVLSLTLIGGGLPFVSFGGLESALEQDGRVRLGPLSVEGNLGDVVTLVELFAIGAFAVQFMFGAALLKLGWEMRWYMVSDQSIRIREGLLRLNERTMTIANIQNMAVRQGPIQKLFGLSDLEVRTAGGGSGSEGSSQGKGHADLHVGRFRGLDNAEELRDRIRAALARHRDAGLGDPDEDGDHPEDEPAADAASDAGAVEAALALLEEARSLRAVVEAGAAAAGTS